MPPKSTMTALLVLCGVLSPVGARAGSPREGGPPAPTAEEASRKRPPRADQGDLGPDRVAVVDPNAPRYHDTVRTSNGVRPRPDRPDATTPRR